MNRPNCLLFAVTLLFCTIPSAESAFAGPDDLGKVQFPTSCSESVQPAITTGVALLHSFQYQLAQQTFSDVVQRDPRCAMAHWGKAMSLYHHATLVLHSNCT